MSTPLDEPDAGNTPLTRDERAQLVPDYIVDRESLNAAEQYNILAAVRWARRVRPDVLQPGALVELHRRMFDRVWGWAGQFRQTERNIGVAPAQIAESLARLMGDTRFWIENETYGWEEIAARFHHQLVFIHPFPNGNGRWARLSCEQLLQTYQQKPFSWGRNRNTSAAEIRRQYIEALRAADRGDYSQLLTFLREDGTA